MDGIGRFSGIALECTDPMALAAFYTALAGRVRHEDWVSIGGEAGWHLSFQRSPGHVAPIWPDPASSMQFHLRVRPGGLT